ncbi:BTAD domain-containing putative transcriptional regulator [Symbioplanes lichenis]|uniref:BTAD domain-containing putative transcriptional regulator n=1 Tax=Symbioplanes lichenis TaxID=1629072 RepID=UPI0027389D03|nr:BTAD domain-containing putative transcriptional regulator [Actinoplanes lichenis]
MPAVHAGIDLRLLGPVRAWRDGAELTLGSARRTAVFCVLALHAGHPVSREQLVAAVWGDDAPASATGNVYTYVSALRQLLEPARDRWAAGQLLTSGGGTYQLHVAPADVDVFRFEALREESRRHRAAGHPAAELAALESALRLWHGDALAGVPGPFAEAQRLRLTELRLATAERHAALLVETGRHEEAVHVLRGLVTTYPLQENLRHMLATALAAAGRGAEAAGVRATAEPAPPAPAPERPRPADRAALIGREGEIRLLRRAAAEAAIGHGRSIRIEGTPGLGRSALLTVALRGAAPAGCRIGWAVGDEVSQRMPLGVLLECIESAMADDASRALVTQLFAIAADALDGPTGDTVARAAELVHQAADRAPLILVADDLQWADPITLGVWAELSRQATRLPLLLVAATRHGSEQVRGLPADELIELRPLSGDASAALVRAVAPEPPDPRALQRMLAEAGGNPYYLRHLAAAEPGASLSTAVGAHLAPLSEETRQILRAVAFLSAHELHAPGERPPGCTISELAAVTDRPPADLVRALAPALAGGLLVAADVHVAFRHRVVARVLHESTPAGLRTTLHRSFAERIAATGGPPEQVVAQLLAGDVPLGGSIGAWLAEHAEQLAGRAPQIAVTVLQRARAQYDLDPARRLILTAWLARLLAGQGRNAAAEAGWVAARTTDPDLEGEMRWLAATSHEIRGEYEAAAEIARAALREQRITLTWSDRFRTLLSRIRPHLPGNPTMPHLSRSAMINTEVSVIR